MNTWQCHYSDGQLEWEAPTNSFCFTWYAVCPLIFLLLPTSCVVCALTVAAGHSDATEAPEGPPVAPCSERLGLGQCLWSRFQMFLLMGKKHVGRRSWKRILPNTAGAKTQSDLESLVSAVGSVGSRTSRAVKVIQPWLWAWIIEGLVMIMTMMMAKHSCVLLPLLTVARPSRSRSCDQCEGSNICSWTTWDKHVTRVNCEGISWDVMTANQINQTRQTSQHSLHFGTWSH